MLYKQVFFNLPYSYNGVKKEKKAKHPKKPQKNKTTHQKYKIKPGQSDVNELLF